MGRRQRASQSKAELRFRLWGSSQQVGGRGANGWAMDQGCRTFWKLTWRGSQAQAGPAPLGGPSVPSLWPQPGQSLALIQTPLTLAPFWAGVSALPSGPKNVPGSPFSPWNGAAGQKASSGKNGPRTPRRLPLAPTRHPRTGSHEWGLHWCRETSRGNAPGTGPVPRPLPTGSHPVTPDSPLGLLTLGPGMPCWPLAPRSPFGPAGPCGETQRAARNAPALDQDPQPSPRRLPETPGQMGAPASVPRPHGLPPPSALGGPTPHPRQRYSRGSQRSPHGPAERGQSGLPPWRGCPRPAHPGVHVPRGLARSPALSVHGSAEPWRKKEEGHIYYDVSHRDPQRVSIKEILPRSPR